MAPSAFAFSILVPTFNGGKTWLPKLCKPDIKEEEEEEEERFHNLD
jgi:hypothetical protein